MHACCPNAVLVLWLVQLVVITDEVQGLGLPLQVWLPLIVSWLVYP